MMERERRQVESEIFLLKNLEHENVVRYLGRELRANKDMAIFMEYLPASLHDAIARVQKRQRPAFGKQEAKFVIGEVARGLHYLHTLTPCVMHRDLKSKNVLVEWSNKEKGASESIKLVKLCDFGVAKALTESTVANTFAGTIKWMAPEVVKNQSGGPSSPAYTPKADVWSLGMVLFEMIELTLPYREASNHLETIAWIVKGRLPTFANTAPAAVPLIELTKLCLRLDPAQRPTAREFIQELAVLK